MVVTELKDDDGGGGGGGTAAALELCILANADRASLRLIPAMSGRSVGSLLEDVTTVEDEEGGGRGGERRADDEAGFTAATNADGRSGEEGRDILSPVVPRSRTTQYTNRYVKGRHK